jgi:hypothetical protein
MAGNQNPKRGSDPKSGKSNTLSYAIVILLVIGAYLGGRYYRQHKHEHQFDAFAQCLASRGAKMYGLYWCPHCADQKAMFGPSFQYVPYVECATGPPGKEMAAECKAAGVKLFPSWQFGPDSPKEGVLSLQVLSEKTGCELP